MHVFVRWACPGESQYSRGPTPPPIDTQYCIKTLILKPLKVFFQHISDACILQDMGVHGHIGKQYDKKGVKSWRECQEHCKSINRCHAWTYYPATNNGHLKNACRLRKQNWKDNLKSMKGLITGAKDAVDCAG